MKQLDKMTCKQKKHCGSCRQFSFEDMDGYGICDKYDIIVRCEWKGRKEMSKKCKYYDKKEQNHDL